MIAYITEFKTIKRILSVVLALCMIFALSACNDNTEKPTGNNNSVASSTNSGTGSSTDADGNENSDDQGPAIIGTTYNVNADVSMYRSDYSEVREDEINPNKYAPRVGYKDAEANAMREKILNTGNTEEYYKITGTKYYFSPGGNDENDGKSPETALRTLEALSQLSLEPGDAVLLERDSIFRTYSAIQVQDGVTYGSYGKGAKPQIYGSPYNFAAGDYWEPTKMKNVWKAEYLYEFIGCAVYNHGEVVGNLRWDPAKLSENGDFYNAPDEDAVYIYCDKGNPSKAFESIEFAVGRTLLRNGGAGNCVIDNLCLKYGGFGITLKGDKENCYVTNCEMAYIGGYAATGSTTRKGNAVEIGGNSKNVVCSNNWIYQIYDTALTLQTVGDFYDIYFTNNLLEYNCMDFEYFSQSGNVMENFHMDNNIIRFSSSGWGCRATDAGMRNGSSCMRGNTSNLKIKNVTFRNNIIDSPAYLIFQWINRAEQREQIDFSGNTYYFNNGYRTSDLVISRMRKNEGDTDTDFKAKNAQEFKDLFSFFDPNVTVYWYD